MQMLVQQTLAMPHPVVRTQSLIVTTMPIAQRMNVTLRQDA